MVSDNFKEVLAAAGVCASRLGHPEVTVTHVTYILSTMGALDAAFLKIGVHRSVFEERLLEGLASAEIFAVGSGVELKTSKALNTCIYGADRASSKAGKIVFDSDDFLIEALEWKHDNPADDFARVTFYALAGHNAPAKSRSEEVGNVQSVRPTVDNAIATSRRVEKEAPHALTTWAVDLVSAAKRGELDEVFGRDEEIGRVCNVLRRRRKNNPMLIGEPGVGKTAVVEGLAVMIANGNVPEFLRTKRIYALDLGRIVSGTRNRGDLEERFKGILDEAAENPNVILFIDEIHTLMMSNGAMTGIPDLLKPALAGGRLRCIGATTLDEFSRYFGADPAMVRRFQEVNVIEPERNDAIRIIRQASEVYAKHHSVTFSDDAIVAAVDLSIRYLVGRQLPDKALDILDEAAARAPTNGQVTTNMVLDVVREMSRDRFIGVDSQSLWSRIYEDLKIRVQGRDELLNTVVNFLRGVSSHPISRSGAKASFLLQGPDGAGKRHIAESMAGTLGLPLLALDMGAYSDKAAASSLIGAPPGYIGYDEGGKLTEFARRHPVSVILIDKVEKAGQAARDIISAAIANGELIDARGRKASFKNAIFVVTNDSETAARSIGFRTETAPTHLSNIPGMSFDRSFSLELLDRDAATEMLSLRLNAVASSYSSAGAEMIVEPGVAEVIATHGADVGGRAGDYVAAFSEMFEAELFKKSLPQRSKLVVSSRRGQIEIRMEVADDLAA
jgi:ATPases with chaperone activity, ATP-binding subunit